MTQSTPINTDKAQSQFENGVLTLILPKLTLWTPAEEKETMTNAKINHFRRSLLDLRKRVGGDLTELEKETLKPVGGELSGGLSDVPVHPADLGTEEFEKELSLTLLENEEQLLAEIDDALDRIEKGTYGRCENCHQEIPRGRLEALPYARYCIRCTRMFQGQASE